MAQDGLLEGEDGKLRCFWSANLVDYMAYHDEEWGRPEENDTRLFEKICLEGFQAGLSWLTILRKRDNLRRAFDNFDFNTIALYNEDDVERLMQDQGIIRHRRKIRSVINNAKQALSLIEEKGSLANYFWSFELQKGERPQHFDYQTLIANPTSQTSTRISKDLKKRGWSFVGPTTIYAFMQAMGMVNDHIEGCHCRANIEDIQQNFTRPTGR